MKTLKIIKTVSEMQGYVKSLKKANKIGFVPTMGYLHKGHLSLVEKSIKENDITIVSIFVNPLQFGKNEDLDKYPRDFERDQNLLSAQGVDVIFFPDFEEIYPEGYKTFVEVKNIGKLYCGATRSNHFKGVTTIVLKLINIINPDFMYMGEKDFQQVFILQQMIKDLNLSVKIVRCPIIREPDGLAMSSRNAYLNGMERKNATCLYNSLILAKNSIKIGEFDPENIRKKMIQLIEKNGGVVEYIAFINKDTFKVEKKVLEKTKILLAVRIGKTRLIDNG